MGIPHAKAVLALFHYYVYHYIMKKFNQFPLLQIGMVCVVLFNMYSCNQTASTLEQTYLQQIQQDFVVHRNNVADIDSINKHIVKRIDSLFDKQRADTTNSDLINGIMNTRSFNKTILAYKDMMNNEVLHDKVLRLQIARHVAYFEGFTASKRHWDNQWDVTARPYLYKNGLSAKSEVPTTKLYGQPEFMAILWDRRMFANDVLIWAPRMLASADSVLLQLEIALGK